MELGGGECVRLGACLVGTMLFAGSFRHSQARATSLPEGGFGWCGLLLVGWACSVGARLWLTPHPSPKGDTFSHWRRLKYRLLLLNKACREGTRLFALSFRHSQARATSLPEGGIAVRVAFGGLGLLCGCPTRTVVDAGPYKVWLALGRAMACFSSGLPPGGSSRRSRVRERA